jgi:EpsI family protein
VSVSRPFDEESAAAPSASSAPLPWIFALWLAAALLYWPTSRALAGFWNDTIDRAYTHGWLVLVSSLWLIVRDRRALAQLPLRGEPRALLALALLSAAWLWFWQAALQDLHLLLLPLLLLTGVVSSMGWRMARRLLFPIGFLYFAMPVWSDLVGVLQQLSIHANNALIWLTGLPAYISGDIVHEPAGSLEIADGCSGLHFFVVGLALAALYGRLSEDSLRWRITWLAMMGILAVLANWIRIFVIVVAAYATDMQTYLVRVDHYWFGWGVFVVCFALFLWLAERVHPAARTASANSAKQALSQVSRPGAGSAPSRVSPLTALATLICLAALPAALFANTHLQTAATSELSTSWPNPPAGWEGPATVNASDWQPIYHGASLTAERRYRDTRGETVDVFLVAYRQQRQSGKLESYENSPLGENKASQVLNRRTVSSPAGDWDETTIQQADGQRALIWSSERIGAHRFVHPRLAQLWYGIAALLTPTVSSLTALHTLCLPSCNAARQRLLAGASSLQPTLQVRNHHPAPGVQGESP